MTVRQRQADETQRLENERLREEIARLRQQHEIEKKQLRDEHSNEIKARDEKIDSLKKQIAGIFKDNSWERQVQIDDLTKELKRTQEEYDLLKQKFKGIKNGKKSVKIDKYLSLKFLNILYWIGYVAFLWELWQIKREACWKASCIGRQGLFSSRRSRLTQTGRAESTCQL